jgi:enoyl-CoA hydratase/carnithine racemase
MAGAATVTLCRPEKRNAMTPGTWQGLAAIGRTLPPEVRVVIVCGEGPSFSAGLDRRVLTGEPIPGEDGMPSPADPGFEGWVEAAQAGFAWLRDPARVSVALVQGHAIGAGFQLALGCDLRVLGDDAQLCMKEPTLGLVPDLMGTKPLVDIVGLPRALEICLTGRFVAAPEALELRLAELVVPVPDLAASGADLAGALLCVDAETARATKELLTAAPRNTLAEQAAAERRAQTALLRSRLPRA